jgi:hypothetical protein
MPPTDEVDGGVPDLPNQNAMVSTKYFYFFIIRSKSEDWLARYQDNVSEWSNMLPRR